MIYKLSGTFDNLTVEKLYEVPGWHRSAFLSPGGDYFVSGYSGLNLVPRDVKGSEVMITIWKRGVRHREVTLKDILRSMDSLEATASHYHWGHIEQVYPSIIHIETVEGRVFVDLNSGEVRHAF